MKCNTAEIIQSIPVTSVMIAMTQENVNIVSRDPVTAAPPGNALSAPMKELTSIRPYIISPPYTIKIMPIKRNVNPTTLFAFIAISSSFPEAYGKKL